MKKSGSIKKQIPSPFADYQTVFKKHFNVSENDFELKPLQEAGPVIIKFNDEFYEVVKYSDLRGYAKELLTNDLLAMYLPVDIWLDLAEDIHLSPKFILNLMDELDGKEEFELLSLALNISNSVSQDSEVFWQCLYNLDDVGLYAKAIVAASITYDLETMVDELIEAIISYPEHLISQMDGDFFETIYLNEQEESDENVFYIYNVEPILWG
jgi:hypothetical protein